MMTLNATELGLYALGMAGLWAVPGPVWVALLARALSGGFAAAWPLALGVTLGDLLWPSLAIFGMGWVLSHYGDALHVLRGLAIAVEGPTLFARLLAGSITLSFFVYAFVNMGMVSGILPVVGVPLPFISYGGTAMVTLGLGLGILMSVAKAKQLVQS